MVSNILYVYPCNKQWEIAVSISILVGTLRNLHGFPMGFTGVFGRTPDTLMFSYQTNDLTSAKAWEPTVFRATVILHEVVWRSWCLTVELCGRKQKKL